MQTFLHVVYAKSYGEALSNNKQETSRLSHVPVLTIWCSAVRHAAKSAMRNREAPGIWYTAYRHEEKIS